MLNQVQLIGNLGDAPTVHRSAHGDFVTFSVATTEKWTDDKGVKQEATEWHNVTVFHKRLADLSKDYLQKGSRVFLQGKIRTEKYDKDGQTHYATKIVLGPVGSILRMLDNKKDAGK